MHRRYTAGGEHLSVDTHQHRHRVPKTGENFWVGVDINGGHLDTEMFGLLDNSLEQLIAQRAAISGYEDNDGSVH